MKATEVLEIKAAVRKRDGMRCGKCGMDNERHLALYGKSLDVHRLVPRSVYSLGGCVTLCRACHGTEPKKTAPLIVVALSLEDYEDVCSASGLSGRSVDRYAKETLIEAARAFLVRERARLAAQRAKKGANR